MALTTSPNEAQQIVLDTDPELISTDNEYGRDNSSSSGCCLFAPFRWYLDAICCNLGHSILVMLYHAINFGLAIALIIFDTTSIGVSVGMIACFCVGVPLLWISLEIILLLARFDLGLVYLMVEQKKKINPSRKHLLELSLYFNKFPLCCCWNNNESSTFSIMFSRMKYLFTSLDMLCYIVFQVFIKPFSMFCWGANIVCAVNIGLLGLPVWYLADDHLFKQNKVYMGYSPDCNYSQENHPGVYCPDSNPVWIINNFGRAFGVAIIALLILPLTLKINNFLAYLNKITIYKFYTYYYTSDETLISDKISLIPNKPRMDTV